LVLHCVRDVAGGEDLPRLRQRPHSGSDVHAVAEDLVAAEHGLAQVEADPDLELRVPSEFQLNRQSRMHRIDGALEGGERLVAWSLDEAAAAAINLSADELAVPIA
jgi:hypothetical protein